MILLSSLYGWIEILLYIAMDNN
ncbi:protein of unknown function [Xenorhabdus bovienii]|uniref:Uncharacterized protein n=1 Tax=Xenorhabdus bovienii TaxID=40576 RepID=A0A0B6X5Q1_XENBV|nr:protein of unknown function [Xenorhabdus bovienii]